MKLSSKSKYAIRALLTLASLENAQPLPVRVLAEKNRIPLKFLEQILSQLKKAGVLGALVGASGGYFLARSPAEITLGQIIRVLDGTVAPVSCISKIAYEPCTCPDENTCLLRVVMGEVREGIVSIIDTATLESVLSKGVAE